VGLFNKVAKTVGKVAACTQDQNIAELIEVQQAAIEHIHDENTNLFLDVEAASAKGSIKRKVAENSILESIQAQLHAATMQRDLLQRKSSEKKKRTSKSRSSLSSSKPVSNHSEACTDNDKSCKAWSKLGECTKNPSFMKDTCRRSCKLCKGNTDDAWSGPQRPSRSSQSRKPTGFDPNEIFERPPLSNKSQHRSESHRGDSSKSERPALPQWEQFERPALPPDRPQRQSRDVRRRAPVLQRPAAKKKAAGHVPEHALDLHAQLNGRLASSKVFHRSASETSKKESDRKATDKPTESYVKSGRHIRSSEYVQRGDFVQHAKTHKIDQLTGQVVSVVRGVIENPEIAQSVPNLRDVLGYDATFTHCLNKTAICGFVNTRWEAEKAGKVNRLLVPFTDGPYCAVDSHHANRRFLDRQKITAIELYSFDKGDGQNVYDALNRDLHMQLSLGRDNLLDKWSTFMYHFLGALDCINPHYSPRLVYRGMNTPDKSRHVMAESYPAGRKVIWLGVTSTTSNRSIAERFTKRYGPKETAVIFEIEQSLAYPISSFSTYANEEEFIIPPMSQFVTTGQYEKNGYLVIKLYQEDRGIVDTHMVNDGTLVDSNEEWVIY